MGLFGFGKKTEKVTKEVTEGCCCGFVSEEKIVDEPVCGCDGPISEDKTYVAEDCGSAIKSNKIDIYVDDHQKALDLGVDYFEVFLPKSLDILCFI